MTRYCYCCLLPMQMRKIGRACFGLRYLQLSLNIGILGIAGCRFLIINTLSGLSALMSISSNAIGLEIGLSTISSSKTVFWLANLVNQSHYYSYYYSCFSWTESNITFYSFLVTVYSLHFIVLQLRLFVS